jgi:hypothetical protein
VACTQNTPQAPQLVAEEAAYGIGLGVQLDSITRSPTGLSVNMFTLLFDGLLTEGWDTLTYTWSGTVLQVRRLFLGFSSRHRCVFSLLSRDSSVQVSSSLPLFSYCAVPLHVLSPPHLLIL